MDQSIKSRVIALAQTDPFLTVKDLAREAGTTTRYVRTILSEADLSLHELRKAYARRLEKRRASEERSDTFPIQEELIIAKVAGSNVHTSVPDWAELELFQASMVERMRSQLCYVQLLTPKQLTLPRHHDSLCLRQLLPKAIQKQLVVTGQKAEVVHTPDGLGEILDLPRTGQALKLTTVLAAHDEPVALEIRWLGLEGLVLQWSISEPELAIRLDG